MLMIETYQDAQHRNEVVALWRAVFGYESAHNDPDVALDRKLAQDDGLLFVALDENGRVTGTVMAGYDGHRGWLYSVAVAPQSRRRGVGQALVRHAEAALSRLGCMKINLQLLASNEATAAFYRRLGYAVEPRLSMGRVLAENVPASKG
jgi:ribosomal protein S18 acetylase RimI-like enzyme